MKNFRFGQQGEGVNKIWKWLKKWLGKFHGSF